MIATEEEAKKKWCPEAKVSGYEGGGRDMDGTPLPSAMCLGSGCMAWQWDSVTARVGFCGAYRRRGE